MTSTSSEALAATVPATAPTNEPSSEPAAANGQAKKPERSRSVQPVLEKLFELYPHLFGAEFLPLKLGIFQELLAAHPEHFQRDALKAALGIHTRSTRYLQSVAAGHKRHDLQNQAVDDVAPEHVYLSLLELFRRRQARAREDLRPKFRAQLMAAFEASGLSRQDYQARVQTNEADATALLEEAFAERDEKMAREEALLRTFESSGKTPEEFADMYGLNKRELTAAIARRRRLQDTAVSA
jgi:sRNA-binding protein